MGEEIESGHQQDGVYAQQPMVLEHLLDFVEEDARLGLSGLFGVFHPLLSSAEEDFALGKKGSQQAGEGGDAGAGPEQCAPGGVGNEVQVDHGGDEIADSISLLHDTAGKTTSLDREVLEGGGGGQAPDASHTDTEETSDSEELMEGLNVTGTEGEDGNYEKVADQRPLPAKSIGEETEGDLGKTCKA